MNKIQVGILVLCLFLSQVQGIRMLHKDNRQKAEKLLHLAVNTFMKQYGGLTLRSMGLFQDYEDITFKDLRIKLVPEESEDGEEKVYNGTLEVDNLKFKAASQAVDDHDKADVEIPNLVATFKLFSNHAFISMDELKFNEENELYQSNAPTAQILFNMVVMRNLKALYNAFLHEEYDEQTIVNNLLEAFEQKHKELNPTKPGEEEQQKERKSFSLDINDYLGRQKPKWNGKHDQEIVIENLEQLKELKLNFNLGPVKGNDREFGKPLEEGEVKPEEL